MQIEISDLDQEILKSAQKRVNNLIKPKGSLGKLEDIYVQLAGIFGDIYPKINKKSIIVSAADHGIVEEGVATSTKEITLFQANNMTKGITGVCALANQSNSEVIVVDVGINNEVNNEKIINRKIKYGTNNFLKEKAMSKAEAKKSIEVGIEMAKREISKGVNLIGTGEMGIGNTTPSSAIVSTICKKRPIDVTGIGANLPKDKVKHKADVIKRALEFHKPDRKDAIDILSKVGGLEIGSMAGVMLGAASKNIPVVVDGFISSAAALIAYSINKNVVKYMIPSHKSNVKGSIIASNFLGLKPSLDLNLRLGEGTGCALMFNIIEAATYMNNDMITFDKAGFKVK
ncbi:MAG: nicotinate-nucleotide--dimethylbenzimidazole phosphoribosyltransferase [Bacillota bacterium]